MRDVLTREPAASEDTNVTQQHGMPFLHRVRGTGCESSRKSVPLARDGSGSIQHGVRR